MGNNPNHPVEGSTIKAEPIKNIEDVCKIKKYLYPNARDYLIFVLGTNTNLRASDLLNLKVGQVKNVETNGSFELKEKKTSKTRRITLNELCVKAVQRWLGTPYNFLIDSDFLFKSRKGAVLTVPTLHRMVKDWCKWAGLDGNFGSHTLRKTWGYHQRVTFGVDLPRLMTCFNHSTQRQTLEYLCIQPEEIQEVYKNEI